MAFLRNLCVVLCLLSISFVFFGCAASVKSSSSQSSPSPQAGTLTLSALSFNFSNVTVGQTVKQTLQVSNSGNTAVQLSALTLSNKQFSVSGPAVPATILPSQSVSYTVAFTPTSAGNDSGTLSLVSNASNPSQVVSLSGAGVSASSSSPPSTQEHSVQLSWKASASQVIGYLVYRSETSGGNFSPLFGSAITAETYNDTTVTAGTTYYYVVTAVDSAGAQSGYSNQVTAVVP